MKNLKLNKLSFSMDAKQMAMALCDGNPGAIMALIDIIQSEEYMLLVACDVLGLYGSELYMLYSDCCRKDIINLKTALLSCVEGRISKEKFFKYIRGDGYGIPFGEWEIKEN